MLLEMHREEREATYAVRVECNKEEAEGAHVQIYEIHVRFDGANIALSERLRFALQASTWFPRPLGIVLWSVLHASLVVAGAPLLLCLAPLMLVPPVMIDLFVTFCVMYFRLLAAVAVPLCILGEGIRLVWLFVRFSVSLIWQDARLHHIRVARGSVAEWWSAASWERFSAWTLRMWRHVAQDAGREEDKLWNSLYTPRCAKFIARDYLHDSCKPLLARWCKEIAHMYDAI